MWGVRHERNIDRTSQKCICINVVVLCGNGANTSAIALERSLLPNCLLGSLGLVVGSTNIEVFDTRKCSSW